MSSDKVTSKRELTFFNSDVSKSIAGFFGALVVGALIPRTVHYVMRRVLIHSVREFLILALAGWLTDRVARLIVGVKETDKKA